MHFRFRVPYGNFELFKFLTDVRMVLIVQLRFFQSQLQLVHQGTLVHWRLEIEKKLLQTPCWKEKDTSTAYV